MGNATRSASRGRWSGPARGAGGVTARPGPPLRPDALRDIPRTFPLYVAHPGAAVKRQGGRLIITLEDERLGSVPLHRVDSIVMVGATNITTPVLTTMLDLDVPVVFLRSDGRLRGRLEPVRSTSFQLRRQQFERSLDPLACVDLSRRLVCGKLRNQAALLRRRTRSGMRILPVATAIDRLERRAEEARYATHQAELVGIEGAGGAAYWHALRALLPEATGFPGRRRHGADIVNALVNYLSAMLREVVVGAIGTAGLDPYVSFLHTPMRGRPTLAFDLMEEWRPVLVEGTMAWLLGLGSVGVADLVETDEGPRLSTHGVQATIDAFHQRLGRRAHTFPQDPRHRTYLERLHLQALRVRDWVRAGVAYEAFRWR